MGDGPLFYLGTHHDAWLGKVDVPLFISRRRLGRRKSFRPALDTWALDSGGFSELSMFGKWETSPTEYLEEIDRFTSEIGMLAWAAPQDWMCEPWITQNTGLSVQEHQHRTIESVIHLRERTSTHVIPVLQGWSRDDYLQRIADYEQAGVFLADEKVVGLGSVCRRQHTDDIHALITELSGAGLNLHGFGVKLKALAKVAAQLVSADSLSWSYTARRNPPLPGHEARHINCANCLTYALQWREKVLGVIAG